MEFSDALDMLKKMNMKPFQQTMSLTSSNGMTILKLDLMQSLAVALLVYYLGVYLKKKINFLEKFCIPAPVVGGIVFSTIHLLLRNYMNFSISIDDTLQKPFMMVFFTTIGMSASIELIKKGGLGVVLFLLVAAVLCVFQDVIGVFIANLMGKDPRIGLICGSVTMTGGHGTAGAFGPQFESEGLKGAETMAMAAATFGLVMGSLMGGPLGGHLIKAKNLKSKASEYTGETLKLEEESEVINFNEVFKTLTYIVVAIGIGAVIEIPLKKHNITLPSYVTAMIIAAIFINVGETTKKYHINQKCVSLLGTIGLNAFLALALSTLKLWELSQVAGPMLIILIVQTAFMAFYAYFVTFNIMGRDFDAATIAGGHCGFGMGATPNGVANMTSIQETYGPAPRAFFILPVVGAFLIDIVNMFVITGFVNYL